MRLLSLKIVHLWIKARDVWIPELDLVLVVVWWHAFAITGSLREDIDGGDEGPTPKVGVVIGHVLPVAVEWEGGPDDGEAHREVGEVVIVDELGRGGGARDREEDGRSKEEDDWQDLKGGKIDFS